jgi:hypothetical protein
MVAVTVTAFGPAKVAFKRFPPAMVARGELVVHTMVLFVGLEGLIVPLRERFAPTVALVGKPVIDETATKEEAISIAKSSV